VEMPPPPASAAVGRSAEAAPAKSAARRQRHVIAPRSPLEISASRLFLVDARPHPAVKKHNDEDPRRYDQRDGEQL
jgi:hypothetical protein